MEKAGFVSIGLDCFSVFVRTLDFEIEYVLVFKGQVSFIVSAKLPRRSAIDLVREASFRKIEVD